MYIYRKLLLPSLWHFLRALLVYGRCGSSGGTYLSGVFSERRSGHLEDCVSMSRAGYRISYPSLRGDERLLKRYYIGLCDEYQVLVT